MARPKDVGLGQAFQQKSRAAEDKLRRFQAEQLSSDMDRLFTEETHSDMTVELQYKTLHLHSCIIKARSLDLYNILFSIPGSCTEAKTVSLSTYTYTRTLEDLFRSLYTENDITKSLCEFSQILSTGNNSGEVIDCLTDASYSNKADQEPNGNDLTKNSETICSDNHLKTSELLMEHLIKDSGNTNDKDYKLYDMASEIVSSALKNALLVIGGDVTIDTVQDGEHSADVLDTKQAVDYNTTQLAESNAAQMVESTCKTKCNNNTEMIDGENDRCNDGHESTGNTQNGTLENDTTTSVDVLEIAGNTEGNTQNGTLENDTTTSVDVLEIAGNTEGNTQNSTLEYDTTTSVDVLEITGNTENKQRYTKIKSSKEESKCSVNALLQDLYALKTVVTPCGELGEDLLRLLLTETDCDAQIQINDKAFSVHKCILSCRSMYFGAMLGGSWRESDQEQIVLEGIDTWTMKQTLLYLYGGVVEVDPSCSLGGLIMMSDMYTMEGLKEVVAFNLNKEYCHYFHRPCPTCIAGTPEALTLTMIYNMDAMREKCVKWINKNFGKVWPTKQFALLPQEVLEFCVSSAVKDLAMDNVIDTMVECQRLNEKIPRLKWSDSVLFMTASLMDASIEFASQNFVNIVGSKTFRNIDKQGIAFNRQPLDEIFGMVIMALSPENSCQAYLSLQKWVSLFKVREEEDAFPLYSEEFIEFVKFLFKKCKDHLCLYIHQAAHTVEWTYLSKDSQKEIMAEANYVCIDSPNKGRMARPQLTSMQKKVPAASQLSLKEYFDQHFGLRGIDKKSKSPSPARNTQALPSKPPRTQSKQSGKTTGGHLIGAKRVEPSVGTKNNKVDRPPIGGVRPKDVKHKSTKKTPSPASAGLNRLKTKTLIGAVSEPALHKPNRNALNKAKVVGDPNDKTEPGKDIPGFSVNIDNDSQTTSCNDITCDSRQNELSMGSDVNLIRFGQRPLGSAQSTDSFFDNRQGLNVIEQRLIPTFEVKFVLPEQF